MGQEDSPEVSNSRKLPTSLGLEGQKMEVLQSQEARTSWDLWELGQEGIQSYCQGYYKIRKMGRNSLVCFLWALESLVTTSLWPSWL